MRSMIVALLLLISPPLAPVKQTIEPAGCSCKVCTCGPRCLCALQSAYVEVRVTGATGSVAIGSGCVVTVGEDVVILTARHVIEDAVSVKVIKVVSTPLGVLTLTWNMVDWFPDPYADLAFLVPAKLEVLRPMSMGKTRPEKIGEELDCFHTACRLHGTYDRALVVNVVVVPGYTIVRSGVTFGASGACMFAADGMLVGVVSRGVSNDPRAPAMIVNRTAIDKFIGAYHAWKKAKPGSP